MPKLPAQYKQERMIEQALEVWAEFEAGFKRSRKGNLWREWNDLTVTVFRRGRGYKYSIADEEDGVRFSRRTYAEEEDAIAALGEDLGLSDV